MFYSLHRLGAPPAAYFEFRGSGKGCRIRRRWQHVRLWGPHTLINLFSFLALFSLFGGRAIYCMICFMQLLLFMFNGSFSSQILRIYTRPTGSISPKFSPNSKKITVDDRCYPSLRHFPRQPIWGQNRWFWPLPPQRTKIPKQVGGRTRQSAHQQWRWFLYIV